MSKPTNSAARNAMNDWERQCYDWGWADAEERIIELLESKLQYVEWEGLFTLDEYGDYDIRVNVPTLIALIKGEK